MLKLVLRLRAILPEKLGSLLWNGYWDRFWLAEQVKENKLHGKDTPALRFSERAVLVEAIASRYPFKNVLEIGCSYGQTIHILAPMFPEVNFVGVDTDEQRVAEGNRIFQEQRIANATLVVADGKELEVFQDSSFDIVYSIAALLYFHPSDFQEAMSEFSRVGKGDFLFLEMHDDSRGLGEMCDERSTKGPYWLRNYVEVLEKLGYSVERESVANPLWTSEFWQDNATLIEASSRGQAP